MAEVLMGALFGQDPEFAGFAVFGVYGLLVVWAANGVVRS